MVICYPAGGDIRTGDIRTGEILIRAPAGNQLTKADPWYVLSHGSALETRRMIDEKDLADSPENITSSLSNWLKSYKWDYFLTVTNRRPRRDSIAFMRDINLSLAETENSLWSDPDGLHLPIRLFLACEPHKYSHNLHAHGLLHGLPGIYPPSVFEKALGKRFGFSRVSGCRSQDDVAGYCSKYVTKITDGDNYDFFGHWSDSQRG